MSQPTVNSHSDEQQDSMFNGQPNPQQEKPKMNCSVLKVVVLVVLVGFNLWLGLELIENVRGRVLGVVQDRDRGNINIPSNTSPPYIPFPQQIKPPNIPNPQNIKPSTPTIPPIPQTPTSPQSSPHKPNPSQSQTPTKPQPYTPNPSLQSIKSTFQNIPHNLQQFPNLLSYLHHNQATTILSINCQVKSECRGNLQKVNTFNLQIQAYQQGKLEGKDGKDGKDGKMYDWIICEDYTMCWKMFQEDTEGILVNMVKYGVSFRNRDLQFENTYLTNKIVEYFQSRGFYYQEIKSLNLIRPESQLIMIFIRGTKPQPTPLPFPKPPKNFLCIQLVIRMMQNIVFLRQWLGYHLAFGVDKFFIYDNSKTMKSQMQAYDPFVTQTTNKYKFDFACINKTQAQVQQQWLKIWQQFYDHIIVVTWQPRDQNGTIIYGQMASLDDYLKYFGNFVKWTSFTDSDQFLFSLNGLGEKGIQGYLNEKERQGVSIVSMKQRHFMHRYCVKNKRVTDIIDYYPSRRQRQNYYWNPKTIAITKHYVPHLSIHNGITRNPQVQKKIHPPLSQLGYYHYNMQYFNLEFGVKYYINSDRFETDDSLQKRYKEVVDEICKDGCSENFQTVCPKGKEFRYCLDVERTYVPTQAAMVELKKELENRVF